MYAWLMGLRSIAPQELHVLIRTGGACVVDVNAGRSWLAARVPGARHLERPDFEARDLPDADGVTLVFYCSGYFCRKAPNAARRARRLGRADVAVMAAGISGWIEAGLPVESGDAPR